MESNFKVVRHKTASSVARNMFPEGEQMGGETFGGETVEFTFDDVLSGIEMEGLWGYADKKAKTIHLWFDPSKTTRARLINFFTHELFHVFGWPLPKSKKRGAAADIEAEERAANIVGDLAELAAKVSNRYRFPA
jgi:hypothetical protein